MTKNVITISSSASIIEAAKLMREKRIGSLVILQDEKPVAIVTEDDLARRVLAEDLDPKTSVLKVASKPLITTSPNKAVNDAAKLMRKNKIRRLPVVSKNKTLVGIVTTTDLLKYISEKKSSKKTQSNIWKLLESHDVLDYSPQV
jgi:CBS domain-containing protein